MTHPTAALFDMDGTLVDSTSTVELVWTEFARTRGLDPAGILAEAHGVRAADTMRRFVAEPDVRDAVAALEAREIALVDSVVPIPGAKEYVTTLSDTGVPIAVVTSASPDLARARLLAAGFDIPDVLVTAVDVTTGKPDPAGYLLAAERLGVPPARATVFEDAEAGVLAGRAAGARVVVVGDWHSDSTEGLDRIRDFRDLLPDAGVAGC